MSGREKVLLILFGLLLLGGVAARSHAADDKTVELAKKEGQVSFCAED